MAKGVKCVPLLSRFAFAAILLWRYTANSVPNVSRRAAQKYIKNAKKCAQFIFNLCGG